MFESVPSIGLDEEQTKEIPYPHRPFENVPAEIIGHILVLVSKSYADKASEERYRLPSIACRVSRFFYRITISTPLLWSYLHITDYTDLNDIRYRIKSRAGKVPLDIYIGVQTQDRFEELITPVLKICSKRWQNLYITLYEEYSDSTRPFWVPLLQLLRKPSPQLRSIFLESPNIYQGLPALSLPLILTPISPLKTIRMNGCGFTWGKALPHTLETLYVREKDHNGVRPSRIVACLQGTSLCQSLRSLTLDGVLIDYFHLSVVDQVVVFPDSTTLEGLEFLGVRDVSTQGAMVVFNIIKTPNLRHLSLQILNANVEGDPTFKPLLHAWRSIQFSKLEELSLGCMSAPEDSVMDFISNLPHSMTRLNIVAEHEGVIDGVLDALESPRAGEFCSQLRRFRAAGLDLGEIVGLVESRLVNLELVEVDTRDTLADYGDDKMQKKIDMHLDRLGRLVPTLDKVWTHDYYSSIFEQGSLNLGKWKSNTLRSNRVVS